MSNLLLRALTLRGMAIISLPITWFVAWMLSQPYGSIMQIPAARDELALAWCVALLVLLKAPHEALHPSAALHGSARWATRRDLAGLRGKRVAGSFTVGQAFGRPVTLPPDLVQRHLLIVGSTGTGKSRALFIPNAAHAQGSFVATDPKGELWDLTSGYHERAWRFAPREPHASMGFNWIPACQEPRVADLLARAVVQPGTARVSEGFWEISEQAMVSALFQWTAQHATPTPGTLFSLLQAGDPTVVEALGAVTVPACRALAATYPKAGERLNGVLAGVRVRLGWLADPAVLRFTSSTLARPDFRQLTDESTAVYWVLHEADVALLRPLSSLFFTLLLETLLRAPGTVPVTLYLDEFANLGTLPDFPTIISVARGRGLGLVLGIQGLGQLEGLYGRAGADTIKENTTSKAFLHGSSPETSRYVSDLLGDATVHTSRQSRSQHGATTSDDARGRPLLTGDETRRLGSDELLLVTSNLPPARVRKAWWSEPPLTAEQAPLPTAPRSHAPA